MATEFVAFQPPPGDSLANYDRTAHFDAQPSSVPRTFREAMEVREEVFVDEQKVPLENELDEDDPRAFHWVVYASVGNTAAPSPSNMRPVGSNNEYNDARRGSESTATRLPVGTIRLVPPPHKSHAKHVGHDEPEASTDTGKNDSNNAREDTPKSHEPYIKLGRLAVLKPYRGLGLSRLLVNAALHWAKDHVDDIVPPISPAQLEAAKQSGDDQVLPWSGLVLVHAQVSVRKMWERQGFIMDESMGTWIEEGIDHIGLWKRIEVNSAGGWKSNMASPGMLEGDRRLS